MKITLNYSPVEKQKHGAIVVGIYENNEMTPSAKIIDKMTGNIVSKLIKQGAIQGKLAQTLPIFQPAHSTYDVIVLVGCGKQHKTTATGFAKIACAAAKALNSAGCNKAINYLAEVDVISQSLAWKIKQLAEISQDAMYRFDMFKSEKEPALSMRELTLHLPDNKQKSVCETALKQALAIASAVQFTKNLANTPSNICTPTFLAEQAKAVAKQYKSIAIKVLNETDMRKLGMGALLAVSQGSAEEAKLICLEYKGAGKAKAPVALIGKGITFDTGGNSIKPADSMVGMKYDMCGAATVLGTIKAAAELKLPINVVGIMAAVENMPGGTAYKPEDILTSMSGQTIEVISTDAEGRLVLADALTYCERYKPDVVIDIATLTGAVVIALGFHATGLVSSDDKLSDDLLRAGMESNDRAWRLPLWEEYQEQIKSPFADMANTGGRSAGTITAACFLSRFTKKFKWAHLDVAGTAAMMMGTQERKATGRPVPMLVQYLIDRSN